ncbi:hypothetical protein Tco_0912312 [Tanacetum coccineum]
MQSWLLYATGYSVNRSVKELSYYCRSLNQYCQGQPNEEMNIREKGVSDSGQAEKKKEPEEEYIMIPFYITDPLISQYPSTPVSTAGPSCTDDDLSSPVNAAEASNAI